MHTVELYELATAVAESLGYHIRQENLGGIGGGACEVGSRKCLFIDLSLSPTEQLDQLVETLAQDPAIHVSSIPTHLRPLLGLRDAA